MENQPAQQPAQQPAPPARRLTGVAMMLASAASNQFGAAVGAGAFATIGPLGVVAVRQFVGAVVLMTVVRPPLRRFTRRQWWPVIVLGAVFVVMNLSLYTAVDRIGLGLAVTLEFLGPLGVALAASRRLVDVGAAIAALVGVYVLVLPGPSSDVWGIASGLLAGVCWASYILLSRLIGQRTEGLQGAAASSAVAAALSLPVIVTFAVLGLFTVPAVLAAAVAGLLCTVVPYAPRPVGSAVRAGRRLRRVHEREPGAGGRGRFRRARAGSGGARVAGCRDRGRRERRGDGAGRIAPPPPVRGPAHPRPAAGRQLRRWDAPLRSRMVPEAQVASGDDR